MRLKVEPITLTRRLFVRATLGLLLAAWATTTALAQSSSPFGNIAPPGGQPNRQPTTAPQPTAPAQPAPGVTKVLARVEGRTITQEQFDRIVTPYLARLRAQMGPAFTDDILKLARKNAFDELVRHEVLAIEAQRQNIQVSEADTDSLLRQDPMLQTNGKFDPLKLQEFKTSPQSNYLQLLPRLQEYAAVARLDRQVHERLTPSRAEVRAEFDKRTAQVKFSYLPVQTRDISLEPESTEPEWRAYFTAHSSDFVKRAQMRLRYFRLPLPATTDSSARAAAEKSAVERARGMADSLRAGTLADSSAETRDTGLFDVEAPVIPGIGRPPELAAAIAHADSLPSLRVLGSFVLPDAVIVPVVVERHAKRPQTFLEALPAVKRGADAEKRKAAAEADRRAYYDANRERYRGPRAGLTRITLKLASYKGRDIPTPELDRWYQVHGHTLYGLPDSARGWLPPVNDSLRRIVRGRMDGAERDGWVNSTMEKIASGLPKTRDVAGLARANGAVAETLSVIREMPPDSLFSAVVVDSILGTAMAQRARVQGPRSFGGYSVLWRVDTIDTAYVPPFDAVRPRVETDFTAEKARKDEAEGRARYEAHRADYLTQVKYTVDYVTVPIPPADSVRVSDLELKAEYQKNIASYRQEEQVHARHLLISSREGAADVDAKAKARADSLLAAIKGGADFADLAKRYSQDPGSGSQGGDLGWFGRGRMVPEFERAAFALKPGEVSPVVKTQFGYHIIKLDERRAAGTKSFDEVRIDLRNSMRSARADTSARKAAESLRRRLAVAADPKPVAARYGGIKSSSSFAANEPAGELGFVQGLSNDVAKLPAGRWAPTPYRSGRSFVVLRLAHTIPPRPANWDEARASAIQDTANAKRKALLDGRIVAIRAALAAGAKFDSVAAIQGGLRDSGPVSQGYGFVSGLGVEPRLVQKAFAAKVGEVSDTLQIAQGVAWLRVEDHIAGDPKQFEAAQAQITQDLLNKKYTPWLEQKKSALHIEILDAEFRTPGPAAGRVSVSGGG